MIDALYPYWTFTPFQALVSPILACAVFMLKSIGIPASMVFLSKLASPPFIVIGSQGKPILTAVAWPCAGIDSLLVFAIMFPIVMTKLNMSNLRKLTCFIVGLIGTFFVSVLRVTFYFIVLTNQGSSQALIFHNLYSEVFFYAWFILYLLLIFLIERKRKVWNSPTKKFF